MNSTIKHGLSFRVNNRLRRNFWGVIFTLPAVLFFVIFAGYPIIQTILWSFFDYDLASPKEFIGLENFLFLSTDKLFKSSIISTFGYTIGTYLPAIILALVIAIVLNRNIPFRSMFRTINFIPVVISWVNAALIWKLLFHQNGLVNIFLSNFGVQPIRWLLSGDAAQWALIFPSIWKEFGFFMVIFLAGLQNIPKEYYEASKIDGASGWQSFQHITIPLLRPTMVLAIVLALITGLRSFVPQYIMTMGGPAGSTRVMALLIYQTAFVNNRIGRATAMAVVLFLIILLLTFIQNKMYGTNKD